MIEEFVGKGAGRVVAGEDVRVRAAGGGAV